MPPKKQPTRRTRASSGHAVEVKQETQTEESAAEMTQEPDMETGAEDPASEEQVAEEQSEVKDEGPAEDHAEDEHEDEGNDHDGLNGDDEHEENTGDQTTAGETEENAGDEELVLLDDADDHKEDKDDKHRDQDKRRQYFRPARLDFIYDRQKGFHDRTVLVGLLTYEDIAAPKILEEIQTAELVSYKFVKDPENPTCGKGVVQMQMDSVEAADASVERLSGFREGVHCSRMSEEFKETDEYKQLSSVVVDPMEEIPTPSKEKGRLVTRTLALSGIPESVTVEKLKELIPEATNITLHFKETLEPKGYAYVEFDTVADAKKHLNKVFEMEDNNAKLFEFLNVPPLDSLLFRIDRENLNRSWTGQEPPLNERRRSMMADFIASLKYYLIKDPNHKERSNIESHLKLVQRRLSAHNRSVRNRGGSRYNYSPRGSRGGGPRGRGSYESRGGGGGGRGGGGDRWGGDYRQGNRSYGGGYGGGGRYEDNYGGDYYGGSGYGGQEAMSLLRGLTNWLGPRGGGSGGGNYGGGGGGGGGNYGGGRFQGGGGGGGNRYGNNSGGGGHKRSFSGPQGGGGGPYKRRPRH